MTTVPPQPPEEMARLLELTRYEILDTPGEEAFDRLTRMAARLLGVPVAAVNLVDVDRHWSKSITACAATSLPREASFCAWTILQDAPTVFPDLSRDPRFERHPAVVGDPHLRFYAGAPLVTPQGHRIGTFCVLDVRPRVLTAEELGLLQDLAAIASSALELRLQMRRLSSQLEAEAGRAAEMQRYLEHVEALNAINTLMDLPLGPVEVALQAGALIAQAAQTDWAGLITFRRGVPFTTRAYSRAGLPPALADLAEHLNTLKGGVSAGLSALSAPLYLDCYPEHPAALPLAVEAGAQSVAWVPLGQWEGQPLLLCTLRAGAARRRPWPEEDRHLLETAARAVRAALNRRAALEAADRAAGMDMLTGILNRRSFERDLPIVQAAGSHTVAVMDLDGFKRLNDTEGHAQGDRVLQMFAGALRASLLDGAQAYRLGGDEFALLLPGCWHEDEVHEWVDTAVLAARQVVTTPGLSLGASGGCGAERGRTGGPGVLAGGGGGRPDVRREAPPAGAAAGRLPPPRGSGAGERQHPEGLIAAAGEPQRTLEDREAEAGDEFRPEGQLDVPQLHAAVALGGQVGEGGEPLRGEEGARLAGLHQLPVGEAVADAVGPVGVPGEGQVNGHDRGGAEVAQVQGAGGEQDIGLVRVA